MCSCIAHRGWSGAAPENTLAAIRMAMADYIDMIEIDVQLSRDGVPVVIHDFTLERTTTGKGMVRDCSLARLCRLDAGSWFGPQFAGEPIPTLEEVLRLIRGKKRLNVELKQLGGMYPGLEEKVVDLVRRYGAEDEVTITSFDHQAVKRVKQLAPEIKAGPLYAGQPVLLAEQLGYLQADVVSVNYFCLTPRLAGEIQQAKADVIVWTVDDIGDIRKIIQAYKTVKICTNYPDRWKEATAGLPVNEAEQSQQNRLVD